MQQDSEFARKRKGGVDALSMGPNDTRVKRNGAAQNSAEQHGMHDRLILASHGYMRAVHNSAEQAPECLTSAAGGAEWEQMGGM